MTTRSLAAIPLVSLTVLATGCGWLAASRPVGTDERPRLSRSAFVRAAETACGRRARTLAALPRPRTDAERRAFFASVASAERLEAAALAALRPPVRDEPDFDGLLAASAELAVISDRFLVAVARDDGNGRRRALAAAERAGAAYDDAARSLGLDCRQ